MMYRYRFCVVYKHSTYIIIFKIFDISISGSHCLTSDQQVRITQDTVYVSLDDMVQLRLKIIRRSRFKICVVLYAKSAHP